MHRRRLACELAALRSPPPHDARALRRVGAAPDGGCCIVWKQPPTSRCVSIDALLDETQPGQLFVAKGHDEVDAVWHFPAQPRDGEGPELFGVLQAVNGIDDEQAPRVVLRKPGVGEVERERQRLGQRGEGVGHRDVRQGIA
eukprot:3547290-Rhodomonas_salina.1